MTVRTKHERLEPLLFRVQLLRIRAIAFRNGTLDRNTVNGWHSRADISGNTRHFCDGEFNFRKQGRTLRDESLETNTARDLEQVVRMFVEMDVGPVSPSSTTQDTREILHSAKDLGVGIASPMIIHHYKTMLRSISAVFTHLQESQ